MKAGKILSAAVLLLAAGWGGAEASGIRTMLTSMKGRGEASQTVKAGAVEGASAEKRRRIAGWTDEIAQQAPEAEILRRIKEELDGQLRWEDEGRSCGGAMWGFQLEEVERRMIGQVRVVTELIVRNEGEAAYNHCATTTHAVCYTHFKRKAISEKFQIVDSGCEIEEPADD